MENKQNLLKSFNLKSENFNINLNNQNKTGFSITNQVKSDNLKDYFNKKQKKKDYHKEILILSNDIELLNKEILKRKDDLKMYLEGKTRPIHNIYTMNENDNMIKDKERLVFSNVRSIINDINDNFHKELYKIKDEMKKTEFIMKKYDLFEKDNIDNEINKTDISDKRDILIGRLYEEISLNDLIYKKIKELVFINELFEYEKIKEMECFQRLERLSSHSNSISKGDLFTLIFEKINQSNNKGNTEIKRNFNEKNSNENEKHFFSKSPTKYKISKIGLFSNQNQINQTNKLKLDDLLNKVNNNRNQTGKYRIQQHTSISSKDIINIKDFNFKRPQTGRLPTFPSFPINSIIIKKEDKQILLPQIDESYRSKSITREEEENDYELYEQQEKKIEIETQMSIDNSICSSIYNQDKKKIFNKEYDITDKEREMNYLVNIKSIDDIINYNGSSQYINNIKKILQEGLSNIYFLVDSCNESNKSNNNKPNLFLNSTYSDYILLLSSIINRIKSQNINKLTLISSLNQLSFHLSNFQKIDKTETIDFQLKINELTIINQILIDKNTSLSKEINNYIEFNRKSIQGKGFEELLNEQFEKMRSSFLKQIQEKDEQILNLKKNLNEEIFKLKEENMKLSVIKNIYINQIGLFKNGL